MVDASHAAKLSLWLGLHRAARRRQLAAARAAFHAYGGAHAGAHAAASAAAGAGPPGATSPAQRRWLGAAACAAKSLNRYFTDLVRARAPLLRRWGFSPWDVHAKSGKSELAHVFGRGGWARENTNKPSSAFQT